MKARRLLPLGVLVLLFMTTPTSVQAQRFLGLKGHRGHGAVELLLATGILAKLLNHRAKHGGGYSGRHILHALLGGHRYPANHMRYPLEMPSHHALAGLSLQDDLLDNHASMSSLTLPFNDLQGDLMLNQESALLAARAPLMQLDSSSSSLLAAEAQLSQQLMAARRARRLLEAKKLLAAQEATSLLAAHSEMAASYAAAQDVAQAHALFADQSRQVFTSMAAPKYMHQHRPPNPQLYQKKFYNSNPHQQQQQSSSPSMSQYMEAAASTPFQGMTAPPQLTPQPVYRPQGPLRPAYIHNEEARQAQARSDDEMTIPADMSDADAVRVIASLAA